MNIERRTFLVVGLLAMTSCARATAPDELKSGWTDFKNSFLTSEGRISDVGNGGISHSEGQGYGMLLAEAAGDREAFDRLLAWTEQTLARPDEALFSWRYEPGKGVTDPNNATDGDILIAWALMRAGARWGDKRHLQRAREIRTAIRDSLVHKTGARTLLLPGLVGFEASGRTTINLAYYIWPALDAFRQADGAKAWSPVIENGEQLLTEARFGPLALPTDWIDANVDGTLKPAAGKPPLFGFDAIRIPLYLLLGGRRKSTAAFATFWRSYTDQGRPVPAWVNVETGEVAPFSLSEGGCAVVRKTLGNDRLNCGQNGAPDYYSSVLKLLSAL